MAPGSSGFGKPTVGKSGSGCSCCSTTRGAAKPAVSSTWSTGARADAVQRRVDDLEVARAVEGEGGHGVEVVVDDVLAQHRAGLAAGQVGEGADGLDLGRDAGVRGGHDLAAVAEVDLVAVVLRAGCGSRSP